MGPAENPTARLERLLSEPYDAALDRGRTQADAECGDRPLVLHGCGQIGRRLASVLARHSRPPVAFSDNNRALWGSTVDAIPVYAPDVASRRFGDDAAFVVSIWSPGAGYLPARRQLVDLGAAVVVPGTLFFWAFPEELLPHFLFAGPEYFVAHAEEIRRAYQLLDDDASRQQYAAQLEWRLTMDYSALPAPSGDQYFPAEIVVLSDSEVFVDGGAFDGDTLRVFLRQTAGSFGHFYAFEPDPTSFAALERCVGELPESTRSSVTLVNAAVGSGDGCLSFASGGGTSSKVSEAGEVEVPCVRIDDYVGWATYLKLDIEGAEAEALRGAARLIGQSRPRIAVSLYHTPSDVFELPLLIGSLAGGYRFSCRSHEVDGFEFVLYAVPR